MTKKPPGDKKIGGVKSTRETTQVERTEAISTVTGIKPTSGVTGIGKTTGIGTRRPTRTMTLEEREELFKMINEEAEKMFGDSGIPETKRDLVQTAVRMAVDSGLIDSEDNAKNKKKV